MSAGYCFLLLCAGSIQYGTRPRSIICLFGQNFLFVVRENEPRFLNVNKKFLRENAPIRIRNRQVARHLFAWGKHSGRQAGWSECGPTPSSKWPAAPVSRQSSYQSGHYVGGSNPPVPSQGAYNVPAVYTLPEAHVVVRQPVDVAPMVQ